MPHRLQPADAFSPGPIEQSLCSALAKLDQLNPGLNALVADDRHRALATARQLDRQAATGQALPPLAGLIVSVKEVLDLAGHASTWGLPTRRQYRASADAAPVNRLREAGALVIGKGNIAQMLLFHESDNPLFGRVNHPHDTSRSPGGSSGGEAALIASGITRLGLGTDIGGSTRLPASWCGICALMPTAGWLEEVDQTGAPAGQDLITDELGLMAATVDELASGLDVLSPPTSRSGQPLPLLRGWKNSPLAGHRVGYYVDDGLLQACPAAQRAVRQAAEQLARAGMQLVAWTPPELPLAEALFNRYFCCDGGAWLRNALAGNPLDRRVQQIQWLSGLKRWQTATLAPLLGLLGQSSLKRQLRPLGEHGPTAYQRCKTDILAYRQRFAPAMERDGIDLILGPATALPAYHHGASLDLGTGGSYSLLFNLLGYPAGVVPAASVTPEETRVSYRGPDLVKRAWLRTVRGSAGLPIGVQLAARPWQEPVLLAAMRHLERSASPTA